MKRLLVAAIAIAGLVPAVTSAVELKNIRACYGLMGATRYDNQACKLWLGDTLFMAYDIEGLAIDAKSGKASYVTKLELVDPDGKTVTLNNTPNEVIFQLGGRSMPGDLNIFTGPKDKPGKYALQLTVQDKIGKDEKAFKYAFDVLAGGLGISNVTAPALGLPGQHHMTAFAVANLTLAGPAGNKQPNAEITIKLLDQRGISVAPAMEMMLPRDLPLGVDLEKVNLVPLTYPVYCNRAGRYTMEIVANDKLGKKKAELRFTFSVVDIPSLTGR